MRAALELLPPESGLTAVAIEGLSYQETSEFSAAAHDIADIARYYGGKTSADSTRTETVQFKYSIASEHIPMRAAEMGKTIGKFAQTERDLYEADPTGAAAQKSFYQLVTNRPIDPDTIAALRALRAPSPLDDRAEAHRHALKDAAALPDVMLQSFM